MNTIWKVIIALLLSRIISNLTYSKMGFFQYNTETGFFALENIVKFFVNYGISVLIALIIFLIINKLFTKKI